MKTLDCYSCGQPLPEASFGKDRNAKARGGLSYRCRSCVKADNMRNYPTHGSAEKQKSRREEKKLLQQPLETPAVQQLS